MTEPTPQATPTRDEAVRVIRYEVTVWDLRNGDVVKKAWRATSAELDQIEEQYDEPWHAVVVDQEWEENDA